MRWFVEQPLTWLVATLLAYRLGVWLLRLRFGIWLRWDFIGDLFASIEGVSVAIIDHVIRWARVRARV